MCGLWNAADAFRISNASTVGTSSERFHQTGIAHRQEKVAAILGAVLLFVATDQLYGIHLGTRGKACRFADAPWRSFFNYSSPPSAPLSSKPKFEARL